MNLSLVDEQPVFLTMQPSLHPCLLVVNTSVGLGSQADQSVRYAGCPGGEGEVSIGLVWSGEDTGGKRMA